MSYKSSSQSGRTLLEFLLMLAVMVLMTVLGIKWYLSAVKQHAADRDYEDIILTISSFKNQGTARTDSGFADTRLVFNRTRSGKPFLVSKQCPQKGAVTLRIDDVDEKVCELLMKKSWPYLFTPLFFLRGATGQNMCSWDGTDKGNLYRLQTATDCAKYQVERGAFALVFNDRHETLTTCSADEECGECEYCSAKGICESACTEEQTCAKEFETPGAPKECYPTDHIVDGVYCANPDGNGNCCDNKGQNCCPPDKPIMGKNGTCYGCDENVEIGVIHQTQKCARCANRFYQSAGYNNIGWCLPKECPEDMPVMSFGGICYPCDYSTKIDQGDSVKSDRLRTETCSKCNGQRYIYAERYCSLGCPDPDSTTVNGVCTCPNNKPLMDTNGMCHSCNEDAVKISINPQQLNVCHTVCDGSNGNDVRYGYDPKGNYVYYCVKPCTDPETFYTGKNLFELACRSCDDNTNWYLNMTLGGQPAVNYQTDCVGKRYKDGNSYKKCPADISTLPADKREQCVRKVAYLESTGTQWIDTGIIPTKNLSFDATFENPNSPCSNASGCGNVFGTRKGSSNNEYQLTLYNNGSIGVGTRTSGLKFYANVMNHISFDGNETVDINGTKKTIGVSDISDVGTIVLFAIRNLSSVVQYQGGKIYSVKFGNVRDFIPVLDPNGVPAMFDQVEKKLYYNAGTGTFSYGPVVN